jgi:hypothetical protein
MLSITVLAVLLIFGILKKTIFVLSVEPEWSDIGKRQTGGEGMVFSLLKTLKNM